MAMEENFASKNLPETETLWMPLIMLAELYSNRHVANRRIGVKIEANPSKSSDRYGILFLSI